MANEFEQLVEWFAAHCDGDWEHGNQIRLNTLDNPGWSLDVDLAGTSASDKVVEATTVQRNEEDDWIFYEIKDGKFHGGGGPRNISELIQVFLSLVAGE